MERFYSKIIKSPLGYISYVIFILLTIIFSNFDYVIKDIVMMILGGVVILGAPVFCFVYFVFTKQNEISLQAILLDLFFNALFLYFAITVIIGSGNQEMYSTLIFIIPIPSVAIRIAYLKNSKLHK